MAVMATDLKERRGARGGNAVVLVIRIPFLSTYNRFSHDHILRMAFTICQPDLTNVM